MMIRDLRRVVFGLLVASIAGILTDQFLVCYLVALLLYVGWLHRHLRMLLQWLRDPKKFAPPETPGVFEELSLEIDYLRERHKKRKKKLASYLRQFQQATRALPDATVVLGDNGDVQWANDAAARYLGIRWPEDFGQRITNLVRLPSLLDFMQAPAAHDAIEIPSPTNPNAFLSVLMAPYGKSRWLFVARDVTQLHRANQIRSDFVANVSHELRTPITVFRGYLEMMSEQRDKAPPGWIPVIGHLDAHAHRMQSLVEELLLLSRLEQEDDVPNPKPVLVSEMLSDILRQARHISGAREHFFSLEADPVLEIAGARSELLSAFSNLIMNAVNYTPARGVIHIRWYRDLRGAHLEVQDNGFGISEELFERITERFYRVESSRAREDGGTGLGLAIVKHVLLRHHAALEIKSKLGEGSVFKCHFPNDMIVPQEALALSAPA